MTVSENRLCSLLVRTEERITWSSSYFLNLKPKERDKIKQLDHFRNGVIEKYT